ncbi:MULTISPECIES: peptide chain release factor N(5)-glutamine methyltransferase [Leuconostoc]|uniref:Release factor glutamine methyltransferase n=2 Tax=Leuconostoc kimchii TaxID=136609 RepID=D5T441_LEUKI|nr:MULTISPECIES: peptide chain release factor N(5)-glutamine methyltransferase [Leuconostoc]ADG40979.1 protoporphyrinogen oxidase (putative) [Leuconostoc kimchii IMSNU 11154]AEJ31047.1 N5-glutamine S-adenosyl-L-methionine-dependent methyltransferase [Leuconostoc sp. C2]QBR48141.1 peptide chain release factor N(5)-glutamine methyltransferase [Leuconostoc kimchii]
MTEKHFETPKQFKSVQSARHVTSDKLTATKWYDWDDIRKPIKPGNVKISLLEGRKWAIEELTAVGMPKTDAQDNVDFLLSGALNINYAYLRANITRTMPADLATVWPKWIAKLLANQPVQYILGHAPFYGREFIVDERVLIPRPETEQLVEWILKDVSSQIAQPISVLDIGTGSGAIIETLMLENSDIRGFAADISSDALAVAELNAQRLGLHYLHVIESDVYSAVAGLKFDVIVSNPPYIASTDEDEMDISVLNFEPRTALFAEHDGLAIYELLAEKLDAHLTEHGRAYFEIGYKQGQQVVDIMQQALPQAKITLRQDFAGLDRMIRVEK